MVINEYWMRKDKIIRDTKYWKLIIKKKKKTGVRSGVLGNSVGSGIWKTGKTIMVKNENKNYVKNGIRKEGKADKAK